MGDTMFTSRDFNREPGRIKRAALGGPVVVTERGHPSLVVLSFSEYRRLKGAKPDLVEALSMPGLADVPLDTRLPPSTPRPADFE
ncbi:MAG: type II toxin-antitoxin system prevent-host-death family antitoxin [Pseudomonadota bacterium]